jgi:heat shock protein HtpX
MKFLGRSILILLALYGLVFALGDMYLAHLGVPSWGLIAFPLVMATLQFLLSPVLIGHLLDISWTDEGAELPAANREFVEQICAQRGLKVPRIGVIESGTPNAFCFGYTPSSARLVVTRGLLDVLTPDEANSVIAHELGHIAHWDFVVMTVAAVAPLLLYQIYVVADHVSNLRVIGYTAYLCYIVSQYVVLLLNRTRESWADHYSAEVCGKPELLASALVKIAYGMVRSEGEYQESRQKGYEKADKDHRKREHRIAGALGIMGISSLKAAQSLALGVADPAQAAKVMRWDLVNPWARLYQLNSTHPLTAFRVRELNRDAEQMNLPVQYPLPEEEPVRWGSFPLEFVLWAAPVIALVVLIGDWWAPGWLQFLGVELPAQAKPALMIFIGTLWILRTYFRYHGQFETAKIGELIEDVEVSQMRPRAVTIKGELVGKGVPGWFWSSDMVLRDETGIMFILYRQSIPFARWLFAPEAEELIGQQVEVNGWFRRGVSPYVEMSRLTDEGGKTHRTYSRLVQYALSVLGIVIGYLWLSGSIFNLF